MTLHEALLLSGFLEKQASLANPVERRRLLEKKAMSDLCAFGLFKQSNWGEGLKRGLGMGAGIGLGVGVPLFAAGHMLLRDANHQAKDVVRDTRNQAVMTALGLGGAHAMGRGISAAMQPKGFETSFTENNPQTGPYNSYMRTKFNSDESLTQKLAELLLIDDMLESELNKTATDATLIHLLINRSKGADLLRSVQ